MSTKIPALSGRWNVVEEGPSETLSPVSKKHGSHLLLRDDGRYERTHGGRVSEGRWEVRRGVLRLRCDQTSEDQTLKLEGDASKRTLLLETPNEEHGGQWVTRYALEPGGATKRSRSADQPATKKADPVATARKVMASALVSDKQAKQLFETLRDNKQRLKEISWVAEAGSEAAMRERAKRVIDRLYSEADSM